MQRILFYCLLFFPFFINAEKNREETATLVVTYHAEEENCDIDRVHFWLINSQNERSLHPTDESMVSVSPKKNERTIVIAGLEPGLYDIRFLIPPSLTSSTDLNKKGVVLSSQKIVKIDRFFSSISPSVCSDVFVKVPEGIAIVGDPFKEDLQNERPALKIQLPTFFIGKYPVTNAHYAEWLTQQLAAKKIHISSERPGEIYDENNHLLCKTLQAHPLAQISFVPPSFQVLKGKENHPVILVSWYGAEAYCSSKNFWLPTESEWEKAAGMSMSSKNSAPERFMYGFGQNTIDVTKANYRADPRSRESTKVLTSPVGFYNGVHILSKIHLKTADAKSPCGAYDMSGNVWEWVVGDRLESLVKGGCYDSLAEGVRVSERLFLPPDHVDIYTGFRAAKN